MTIYPARGLVYDRHGDLLVYNEAAYDLMVIPGQVKAFDTTELCNLTGITVEEVRTRLQTARQYSYFKPSAFVNQLSKRLWFWKRTLSIPGFFVQPLPCVAIHSPCQPCMGMS
jgi:penicillin-binding protein 2